MLNEHKNRCITILLIIFLPSIMNFPQVITIVMNIINLEGGSAEPPEPPSGYGPASIVAPYAQLAMCFVCSGGSSGVFFLVHVNHPF